jgi:predicted metalloenzyme YecM
MRKRNDLQTRTSQVKITPAYARSTKLNKLDAVSAMNRSQATGNLLSIALIIHRIITSITFNSPVSFAIEPRAIEMN